MSDQSIQPRGLRAPAAAAYLGLKTSKFFELVKADRLPRAKRIDACAVWDRFELDAAFDAFSKSDDDAEKNPWDELCT